MIYLIILVISVFFMGAFMASFYTTQINACIEKRSNVTRSTCWSCNHTLNVIDLLPIVGYIARHGKCKYCGRKIPLKYPVWEFIYGLVAVLYLVSPKLAITLSIISLILTLVLELNSRSKGD